MRRVVWVAVVLVVVGFVVPGVAVAAPGSVGGGGDSALSWTGVRDSAGVPLSSYMFVTSDPSILSPLTTMLAMVLQLLFAVWKVVVTLAIWVVGYALSFGWLDLFSDVLLGTARVFSGQIATTVVLVAAATLGAFIVSYFVLRGLYARATMQVVTMLAVAVFGVVFLANPLAEVLGPDGLLAKGRDLGVSIAAGLLGNADPDPGNVIATMQASLADHLVRKPLQVWNFGHVIDGQCGGAWSSGMMSGDSSQVKSALRSCDSAAYAAADQPGWGQFGAGLVLFVCGLVLVWFAIKLGMRVIRAAMNSVYHGFMSIFGFAAGGYVYGPTQTFLIRNLVDTAFAAFAMTAYTIFLAIYVLVLGDVFEHVEGQVMQVLVVSAVVMVIGSRQLGTLRASLESGSEWVAGRFASATQGGDGVGGGGGPGIGMASGSTRDWWPLATMTAMNQFATAASFPLLARVWGNSRNPLAWQLKWQEAMAFNRENAEGIVRNLINRRFRERTGRDWQPGDEVDGRTLAGLVNYWDAAKLPQQFLASALRSVADVDHDALRRAMAAETNIDRNVDRSAHVPAARAWVGANLYFTARNQPSPNPQAVQDAFEAAGVATRNFLHGSPIARALTPGEAAAVATIEANWHDRDLLYRNTTGDFWQQLSPNARNHLKRKLAQALWEAHHNVRNDPTDPANLEAYRELAERLENWHDVAKSHYKTGIPF
jgi:hypothetical protein